MLCYLGIEVQLQLSRPLSDPHLFGIFEFDIRILSNSEKAFLSSDIRLRHINQIKPFTFGS